MSMDNLEEGWIMQGNHYYHKEDYVKALECYTKAVSHENNRHAAWNIHNRLHDYAKVQEEADKMIELDSLQPKGFVRRGGAAFFQGKFEEAQKDYERAEVLLHKSSKNDAVRKLEANLQKYQKATKEKLSESK